MANHNDLGKEGENIALNFLQKKNFRILEKSWHFKHKEVDIIAEMQNELIFVEVKTRKSNFWGNPENFVTKQKQRFLIEAANQYINKIQHLGDVRFDIIAILYENSQTTIEHIENAFYP